MPSDISKKEAQVLFGKDRDLTNSEYMNLLEKQQKGAMNVDYYRYNVFSPLNRGYKIISNPKKNPVWSSINGDKNIYMSRRLTQKHADVLSLINTKCKKVSSPTPDGHYYIYFNINDIAEGMGYKDKKSIWGTIKKYINEMRETDIITEEIGADGQKHTFNTMLIGDSGYSHEDGSYYIEMKGRVTRILIHSVGIVLDDILAENIAKIPAKYPKIKALVRYMLSNKANKSGVKIETFYKKFQLNDGTNEAAIKKAKYFFRKSLLDMEELLASFNIYYNKGEQKVYYREALDSIDFIHSVNTKKIAKSLFAEDEATRVRTELDKYIGKKLVSKNDEILILISVKTYNEEGRELLTLTLKNEQGEEGIIKGIDREGLEKWAIYTREKFDSQLVDVFDEEEDIVLTVEESMIVDIKDNPLDIYLGKKFKLKDHVWCVQEIEYSDDSETNVSCKLKDDNDVIGEIKDTPLAKLKDITEKYKKHYN